MPQQKLRVINDQLRLEIHESARLADKLNFHATHDNLSGLLNRFGFSQVLDTKLALSEGNHKEGNHREGNHGEGNHGVGNHGEGNHGEGNLFCGS